MELMLLKKELDQEMGDIISKNEGALKIGFPAMRGTYMLPCTLPIFRSLYPEVKIMIMEPFCLRAAATENTEEYPDKWNEFKFGIFRCTDFQPLHTII